MGRDKCLIEFDGQPLWQRQIALLGQLCRPILISAPTRPDWCPATARWVPDIAPGLGPLAGLAATLEAVDSTHLLALAVDLPNLEFPFLQRLVARCSDRRGIVPKLDGFHQPLSAIYPRQAAATARAHLSQPDRSLQSLLRDLVAAGQMEVMPVDESERAGFRNLNTPDS